jgi:hypothetical protein
MMFATFFSGLSLFVLIRHNAAFVVQDIYFFHRSLYGCSYYAYIKAWQLKHVSIWNPIKYIMLKERKGVWIKWVQLMSCLWTFYKVSIWKGTKSVKFPQNSVLFLLSTYCRHLMKKNIAQSRIDFFLTGLKDFLWYWAFGLEI